MKRKRTWSERLAALKRETAHAELDQIRRLLALPMDRRTNFLRQRVNWRGSGL